MRLVPLVLSLALAIASPLHAQPGPDEADQLQDKGLALVQGGKWAEALPVYERIVKLTPDYAYGWMGLSRSLHRTGKLRESIPAYGKALELGAVQPFVIHAELAKVHLALGEEAQALEWLERGVSAKGPSRQRLLRMPEFAALKDDPRFKAIALDIDASTLSREDGWRADIELFASEFKRLHYAPFQRAPESRFDQGLAALKSEVGKLDDGEIAVRLMKILAPHADGHTQIQPPYRRDATIRIVPMQFELAEEGLIVSATRPEEEEMLWGRVVEVNGVATEAALGALAPLISRDNGTWLKARAPLFLRYPQLLKPLGIGSASDRATYAIATRAGERRSVTLEVAPRFAGVWTRRPKGQVVPEPLHLTRPEQNYWFEHLAEERLLYFQFNSVLNQPRGGETIDAFAKRLAERIDRDDVEHVVVDLRRNGGGNTDLVKPLLEAILGCRKTHRPAGLFVIAGRHTFSAAMNFAALLERHADPIFVGESTGSSPNFIGENSELTLPYSKFFVSISHLYWQNGFPQDHRIWIAPQLPAPPSLASLKAGRDPAMDAILGYLQRSRAAR